jgi:hypothetical protein
MRDRGKITPRYENIVLPPFRDPVDCHRGRHEAATDMLESKSTIREQKGGFQGFHVRGLEELNTLKVCLTCLFIFLRHW